MKIFLLILGLSWALWADNIYLKNGTVIQNCRIVLERENSYSIETGEGIKEISRNVIERIEIAPYDPLRQTVVSGAISAPQPESAANYPNLKLLPVSVIAFTLGWHFFDSAGDLEGDAKTQVMIQGGIIMAAGVWNLLMAVQK